VGEHPQDSAIGSEWRGCASGMEAGVVRGLLQSDLPSLVGDASEKLGQDLDALLLSPSEEGVPRRSRQGVEPVPRPVSAHASDPGILRNRRMPAELF